jgi:hypothetical protein
MSREEVVVEDEVVLEDVVVTENGQVVEEDIAVAIEEELPQKSNKKKILKGVLAGGLMLLGAMVIFSSGFYVGANVGGSSGGRQGGRQGGHSYTSNQIEPIVIETGEGYQNITTLPHVLTEKDNKETNTREGSKRDKDTKDIKWNRGEVKEEDDLIKPMD